MIKHVLDQDLIYEILSVVEKSLREKLEDEGVELKDNQHVDLEKYLRDS